MDFLYLLILTLLIGIVANDALPTQSSNSSKSLEPPETHPPTPKVKKDLSRQNESSLSNVSTNGNAIDPTVLHTKQNSALDLLHEKEQQSVIKKKQLSIIGPQGNPIITLNVPARPLSSQFPLLPGLSLMPNLTITSGPQGHAQNTFDSMAKIFSNLFRIPFGIGAIGDTSIHPTQQTGEAQPLTKQQQGALQFLQFLTSIIPSASKAQNTINPSRPQPSESVSNPLELPLITNEEIYYPEDLPVKSKPQLAPLHKVFPIIFQIGNRNAETRVEFKKDSGSDEVSSEEEKNDEGSGAGPISDPISEKSNLDEFQLVSSGDGSYEIEFDVVPTESILRAEPTLSNVKSKKRPIWGYGAPEYRPRPVPKSKVNQIVKEVYKIVNEITN